MRKTLTLIWPLSLLMFCCSLPAQADLATQNDFSLFPQPHHLEIFFYVDNQDYLEFGLLEIAFAEQHFMRREVAIHKSQNGKIAMGYLEIPVPAGDLNAVVCGHVRCENKAEDDIELICGRSQIPARISLENVHEITFSTTLVCDGGSAELFSAGVFDRF